MDQPSQRFLGSKGLVILIAILSGFVPLSNDMYLPALPEMTTYFSTTPDRLNLTITAFLIFYALGILIWGPLSDKFGRKPILIAGLGIYVIASGFCAVAGTLEGLVIARIFQALGGGAAGAVGTAVVKDVYSGKQRESILAIVQSMVLISPALGPIIGAFLLRVISWQGVFWVLAGIGVVAIVGSLLFEETITQRTTGRLLHSMVRPAKVLQNRGFTLLLLMFSVMSLSTVAFIAASSYIYQDGFHLSRQMYSFYFSFNALGMIAGPMIYLRLARRFHAENIILGAYVAVVVSGVLVILFGSTQPWIFALCILPASTAVSCLRPPATNMMLEQQTGDTGSVSSLINATGLMMGSLGVQLISLPWASTITTLGIMTISTATISLLAWPLVIKRAIRLPGPEALELSEI